MRPPTAIATLLLVLAPASYAQTTARQTTPKSVQTSCVSFDLRFELLPNREIHFANAPTNQFLARMVLQLAGETYWDEITHKGKKSPGICKDTNHPYYILAWSDTASTVAFTGPASETHTTTTTRAGDHTVTTTEDSVTRPVVREVTDHSATAEIYVVDYTAGCIIVPAVFGTSKFDHNSEKADKKALEDALQFLLRTGIQPPTKRIDCVAPGLLGVDVDYSPRPPKSHTGD